MKTRSLAAFALCAAPLTASAELSNADVGRPHDPADAPFVWHLDAALVTDAPASLGAQVTATLPHRIRLGTSLGILPGAYVSLINAVATAAGWYTEDTAEVIDDALSRAVVWTVQLGWQPWDDSGFHVDLGYGLAALGGATSSGEALGAATGVPAPFAGEDYDIDSTLHTLRLDFGWRFDLYADALYLDAAIGVLTTVAAETVVTPPPSDRPFGQAGRQRLADETETYLDDTYTTYVHSPTVTLGLGWRFF
ncbi:MAG: hypothetical protein R3F65_28795 [bacterium]